MASSNDDTNNVNNDNDNKDNGNREPLLKKHYYENCPGCKVDRAKEMTQGVPVKHLINIWLITLCSSLPISSLFPFLYFMVRDFGIAKTEADISSYAGYVGSAFMFGRGLTSVPWGMVADRYGRKPVAILGIIAVIVFNTLFGLSSSFWMAVTTRFLLGALNGLIGPMKAYTVEIVREEYHAIGLSTVSAAWGIGLVVGPALGGYLAQPVEKYPHIFSKGSFFDKFPYSLPSIIISVFALFVLASCLWLPETLHKHCDSSESHQDIEASDNRNMEKIVQKDENLLLNWPLMSSIIAYCVFALHNIAYQEVFSLWAVSPLRLGGLNFTTNDVGNVLSISGFVLLIYQVFLYPAMEKICGPIRLSHISGAITIPLLQSYPFMALLSGFTLHLLLTSASVLKYCLSQTIITGLLLLQNKAVDQHQRGAANGIAMTAMSICKSVGPAGGGAVLAWSQKRLNASFLPGSHLVFFILNLIEALGVLMMFKPFLAEKKTTPSEQLQ
ncbi:protein ZINC INDUCED FACILITATOR 1-like isoform X3 [Neltuma alba]|uniref:protein ZINC INDUCED FACILITATOR 1-like isoform X3 n=1 Tax=Neltuma alba TaxID=207710 RepID=UPI0010A59A56|nr:protein ZINC INDUCED FACILITATOR 1-like isoform X3 [Prosopis alba]